MLRNARNVIEPKSLIAHLLPATDRIAGCEVYMWSEEIQKILIEPRHLISRQFAGACSRPGFPIHSRVIFSRMKRCGWAASVTA